MVTDEAAATTDTPPEEATNKSATTPEPEATTPPPEASAEPEQAESAVEETAPAEEAVADELAAEEEPAAEPPPPPAPEPPKSNKHWYVVKVQSGREETIREAIERKVRIEGLEEYYGQIYIPTESVTEMRKGKRYTRQKKSLPGYFMAEVEYNDRILYLFRETSGVGDFVGATHTKPPPPMPEKEVARWMKLKKDGEEPETPETIKHDFNIGDRVKIKDGMFKDMEGPVKEIVEAKNQVKVEVAIFGRPVIVEMEYWQVEHV